MTRRLLMGLLLCALLFTTAAQDDKTYRADRFDVEAIAQPDRSLVVEETVTFRFTGGPFSFVFRELPTDHTDGITDIVAGVDGIPWPQGTGPGQVEISGRNPIEVTWHLPPTSDTAQTFTLSYRMLGVVRSEDAADVLNFQPLPDEYEYPIDSSRITVNYPPEATMTGQPEVSAGEATVSTTENGVVFDMTGLAPGDPLVVRLAFEPGGFSAAPPAWQTQQAAQNSRAWTWFVTAALILVGGFAAFFAKSRAYLRTIPKATSYLYKPPLELSPALAGYLADANIGWQEGLATLFDLAGRGYVTIEQIREKSLLRQAEFAVTLVERPQGLRPHEQALIDLLFTDKHGVEQDVVTLSEMGKLITSSRWKTFTRTLEDEADREGLLDPNAKQLQKQLIVAAILLLILGIPLFVAAFLLRDLFGMWTLITVGAVGLLGIIGLIFAAGISPLSQKGYQYAVAFEPFRRLLKDVAGGKADLPDLSYYIAHLPYATAYGLAQEWVKRQAKSDYQKIPSYIRAAGEGQVNMAAFVAIIAATSNSGGAATAAAGAAGAGAAGGGASGAG